MNSSYGNVILRTLSTYRGFSYLFPFGLMAIISYNEIEEDLIVWPLGIAVVLVGISIRVWATKHIGRRMPWIKRKGKRIVKTGPYAVVRNPLYIGNIIIAAGLSLLSELFWFTPLIVLYLFFLYHLVVLHEEKRLSERWGEDFQRYRVEVPRWIPKMKHWYATKGGGFGWRNALKSELPSFYVILFAMFVFALKEYLSDLQ